MCVCIYPTPPPLAECDTTLIFKRYKAGLNSDISFSYPGDLTKAKEHSLFCNLLIASWWKNRRIPAFDKGIRAKWNIVSCRIRTRVTNFLPSTITVALTAPPLCACVCAFVCVYVYCYVTTPIWWWEGYLKVRIIEGITHDYNLRF